MALHPPAEPRLADTVLEPDLPLDGIPGILWTPAPASAAAPVPLIQLGHPPLGLHAMRPRLTARARHAAADGFATATIELPGSGDRPPWPALAQARADLSRAMRAGEPVGDDVIDALVLPFVVRAVPEWQSALYALLGQPGIDGPLGYSGGLISVGVRLAVAALRFVAAGLFAGSFVSRVIIEDARRVTIPLHVLLQW